VVSVVRTQAGDAAPGDGGSSGYWVDTLLCCRGGDAAVAPAPLGDEGGELRVVPVALHLLATLSTLRISIPPDLKQADSRSAGAGRAALALEPCRPTPARLVPARRTHCP
jgi:ATP-dependent RNA helicase DOB1